jgi:hypothetical protein
MLSCFVDLNVSLCTAESSRPSPPDRVQEKIFFPDKGMCFSCFKKKPTIWHLSRVSPRLFQSIYEENLT